MAPSANLVARRNELEGKKDILQRVFDAAGGDLTFSSDVLEMLDSADSVAAGVAKIREWNAEINDLQDGVDELVELEGIRSNLGQVAGDLVIPQEDAHRYLDTRPRAYAPPALGDLVTGHDFFSAYLGDKAPRTIQFDGMGIREVRATLLETTAGWDPEDLRIGRLVDAVTRPIQILDIIPLGQTGMSTVLYMLETTRTHAAAEVAEGAAYAEDTYVYAEQSSEVRKIGTSLPFTDEQLEDVPAMQSVMNQRLTFGVRQRLDNQVIQGNGTAPNLRGVLNVVGIQTQPRGTDPVPDAIHRAMTLVRVTGRAFPSHVLMHQNDWQDIRLLRTADGIYIWGSPAEAGIARIWGLPVIESDVVTENTAIVGDFTNFSMLFERRGIDVQLGWTGTQFTEGERTIRADLRAAFVVFRPTAFATVTGI